MTPRCRPLFFSRFPDYAPPPLAVPPRRRLPITPPPFHLAAAVRRHCRPSTPQYAILARPRRRLAPPARLLRRPARATTTAPRRRRLRTAIAATSAQLHLSAPKPSKPSHIAHAAPIRRTRNPTRASTPRTPSVRCFARTIAFALARSVASLSLPVVEMGHEKRKGKEVVIEKPARKRTRAEKEAERAEMVAKAAEEQASGRARPFQIREDPRGRGRA